MKLVYSSVSIGAPSSCGVCAYVRSNCAQPAKQTTARLIPKLSCFSSPFFLRSPLAILIAVAAVFGYHLMCDTVLDGRLRCMRALELVSGLMMQRLDVSFQQVRNVKPANAPGCAMGNAIPLCADTLRGDSSAVLCKVSLSGLEAPRIGGC